MTRIFVGNLSHNATEHQLRSLLSPFGRVGSVSIKTDQSTGRPRGFAFVTMPSMEDAEEAIARLSGASVNGRTLTINEAQSRQGSTSLSSSNETDRQRVMAIFESL